MRLIRQGLERGMFMTFGEKVRSLRKEKKMSQQELASMVGVSYRTIRSWEVEGRFPKQNVLYQKLADALQCDVSYLMSENEAFITEASEQFGNRGARQAQQILEQAAAMFAGGSLTDEDKIAFMDEIQSLYLIPKDVQRNLHRKISEKPRGKIIEGGIIVHLICYLIVTRIFLPFYFYF